MSAVAEAYAETVREMDQSAYYEIAERTLPGAGLGGYSLPDDARFVIREGRGSRLISVDGRSYVDYVGGAGANILGHSHPAVVDAVAARLDKGLHYFGTLCDVAIDLSQVLVDVIPCAEKVIYTTTGSEATSYSMRIARAATGREKILKFEGAYHGNHDYASFSQFPTGPANYPSARSDSGGVPHALEQTMLVAPYNDLEAVEQIVREHGHEIAAIIVEPVQRIIFPVDGFLAGLRRLCDDHGIVLIFDEVVTGFRLSLGGAQELFGVTPDMASFGKIVGGGGPLGCVAGKAELLDKTNPRNKGKPDYAYVNGTLHGNPLAAAAGLATIRELRKPGFYDDLAAKSDTVTVACQEVLDRRGVPAIAAGARSFWQFLFMDQPPRNQLDVLASDMAAMRKLDTNLLRRGIYALPGVRRFVSAANTKQDLEDTLEALDAACASL